MDRFGREIVNTIVKGLVSAVMLATVAAGSANASLLGQNISASGSGIGGQAVIGGGVEFVADYWGDHLYFDFGANTITITKSPWLVGLSGYGDYVFSGFTNTITSLTLVSDGGFAGSILNPSFTSGSVTFNMEFVDMWSVTELMFEIGTASDNAVPEPASLALFAFGFAALAATRRSRNRHAAFAGRH
jgi:hypothetical protein